MDRRAQVTSRVYRLPPSYPFRAPRIQQYMTPPRFSIAMATYNGERFLQEQLDSLARQALPPYELVACDDRSSDSTVSILEAFAGKAPFNVRIYQNDRNLGYGNNFLKAASLCAGEWIAFCDQDDVWLEQKLRRYCEAITEHPGADLLSHSAEQVDADLKPLHQRYPCHKALSVTAPMRNRPMFVLSGFSCCVRQSLLNQIPLDERREDLYPRGRQETHDEFIYHVANTYGCILRMPDSLALYRRHGAALSGTNGTPVHDRSVSALLLRARNYVQEASFLRIVNQARQRQCFYQRILDHAQRHNADEVFLQRTSDASTYYARVASAFEIRARIYREGARLTHRSSALLQTLRMGTYNQPPIGCGLGKASLARDVARVLLAW